MNQFIDLIRRRECEKIMTNTRKSLLIDMKKMGYISLALTIGFFLVNGAYAQDKHFDSKGNPPSKFTIQKWEDVKNKMPFKDKRNFEEQKKGFIAAPVKGSKLLLAL